jgi:Uma2 family endonuclease
MENRSMATTNDPVKQGPWIKKQRPWPRRDGLFRFTVEQFYKLDELGYFEDRKVELIEGIIHEMTTKPPHAISADLTCIILHLIFAVGWVVRETKPLDTGRRSLLEPDFYVLAGSARDLSKAQHPMTAALVVEISDSTLRKDRTIKVHHYAQANLPDYWIVNLVNRQLEVHRNPGPDPARRGRFRYADVTIVPESGRIAPLAAPRSEIAVADLLP